MLWSELLVVRERVSVPNHFRSHSSLTPGLVLAIVIALLAAFGWLGAEGERGPMAATPGSTTTEASRTVATVAAGTATRPTVGSTAVGTTAPVTAATATPSEIATATATVFLPQSTATATATPPLATATASPAPTSLPATATATPKPTAVAAAPRLLLVRRAPAGANSLYSIGADGSGLAPLAGAPAAWNWAPSVSADGQWLSFATQQGKGGIAAMRTDGRDYHLLVERGGYTLTSPVFSPAGEVLFNGLEGSRSSVYAAPQGGGAVRPVYAETLERYNPRVASLTADGQQLVFSGSEGGRQRLYRIGADQQVVTLTGGDGDATTPSLSPDGSLIAYAWLDAAGGSSIRVINCDGSGMKQLVQAATGRRLTSPVWSPDGRRLAFIGDVGAGGIREYGNLYVIAAGGGEPSKLTSDGQTYYWRPAWLR